MVKGIESNSHGSGYGKFGLILGEGYRRSERRHLGVTSPQENENYALLIQRSTNRMRMISPSDITQGHALEEDQFITLNIFKRKKTTCSCRRGRSFENT